MMLRKHRRDEEDGEQGGARPVQPPLGDYTVVSKVGVFTFGEDDARAVKGLADRGGERAFVAVGELRVRLGVVRRLREAGLVTLLDDPVKGLSAQLTGCGVIAIPKALARIAASAGAGR